MAEEKEVSILMEIIRQLESLDESDRVRILKSAGIYYDIKLTVD